MTRARHFVLTSIISIITIFCAAGLHARQIPQPSAAVSLENIYDVNYILNLVDLFVGTGGWGYGAGSLVPGPQTPNGMIRPCPDTGFGSLAPAFLHFAGYWYADTHIRGFSHTRLVGVGISDQGNIRLMPVLGMDDNKFTPAGYLSPFSHTSEAASVGYYSVVLDKDDIRVELAAADHSAIHRYTFPSSRKRPYLIIDAGASIVPGNVRDAHIRIDPAHREVSGSLLQSGGFSGEYGGLPTYFVVRVDRPISNYGTFRGGKRQPETLRAHGRDAGVYIGFEHASSPTVIAKVGLSFISVDQARAGLDAEIPEFDFDAVVKSAQAAWKRKLGLIEVKGGTYEERRIFYTALYHAYMLPTLFTEGAGRYMGFDRKTHTAEGFRYYTDFSLWDTFRTLHPLLALIDPRLNRDFVISLLKMKEQGGDLPMWPMGIGYTNCMIGTHADSVIAEAYLKGITDFDARAALQAMIDHATRPAAHDGRDDLEHYTKLGYCATDYTGTAASKTLEYAYDDYCIGALAQKLGLTPEAETFFARSENYRNVWDKNTEFFRGRNSRGEWAGPFHPTNPFSRQYVEGDAWQWLWFTPHDPAGLAKLFGGPDRMAKKLETFFESSLGRADTFLPDKYYWHGNEPDIHAAYLFNHAGRPDLTQKWVRWILKNKYRTSPSGIDGNDDGGTLSAWYIFSALGLYPLNPCGGEYELGSPIFDEAVLHLPAGDLVIRAENNSSKNIYVHSLTFNGRLLHAPRISHAEISRGGTLVFVMGPTPMAP